MKKNHFGLIVCTVLFLLCICATAMASPGDAAFFTDGNMISSATMSNTLYALTYRGMYRLAGGEEAPEFVLDTTAFCERPGDLLLASGPEYITLFDTRTGQVGIFDGENVSWKYFVDLYEYPETERIFHNTVRNGDILATLLLNADDYISSYTLLLFDLKTGQCTPHKLPRLEQISSYKSGQLLGLITNDFMAGNPAEIITIDMSTGLQLASIGSADGGLAYDAASDSIYACINGQVTMLKNEQITPLNYLNSAFVLNARFAAYLPNGYYVLEDFSGLYIRNTDPQFMTAAPLRITGAITDNQIMYDFTQTYPDIPIISQAESVSSTEGIIQAALTGDNSSDIYVVYAPLARRLIEKGYVEALSSSPKLSNHVSRMYAPIQAALTMEGELYAYPSQFDLIAWSVREDLLTEYGLIMPETLLDYSQMIVNWEENEAPYNPNVTFEATLYQDDHLRWLTSIGTTMLQYTMTYESSDRPITFNTPVLRQALEPLENLYNTSPSTDNSNKPSSSTYDWTAHQEKPGIFNTYVMLDFLPDSSIEAEQRRVIAPLPFALGDIPQAQGNLYVYVINRNSTNKENAMKFVEFAAEHQTIDMQYKIHADLVDPVENKEIIRRILEAEKELATEQERLASASAADKKDIENRLALLLEHLRFLERSRFYISIEDVADYHAIAPFMNLMVGSNLIGNQASADALNQLQERYLAGQLSLDAYLESMDKVLGMMYREQ